MGNFLQANIAQLLFVPVALYIFKRQSAAIATAIVVVGGTLFLPETRLIDISGIPYIDKSRIVYITALLGMLIYHSREYRKSSRGFGLELFLIFMFVANIGAMMKNGSPMMNNGEYHKGLGLTWLISQIFDDFFMLILPFYVARVAIRSPDDIKTVFYVLVSGGAIYTILIFLEVLISIPWRVFRLSYYLFDFPGPRPNFKYGLIEPVVFMISGHAVATYMVVAIICAAAVSRTKASSSLMLIKKPGMFILAGLSGTLKFASLAYGVTTSLMVTILSPRKIAALSVLMALLACAYPVLRVTDLFPTEAIVEVANALVDEQRAGSLSHRFDDEDFIMGNQGDNFWFGWGHFGRVPEALSFYGDSGEAGIDGFWNIQNGSKGIIGVELVFLFFLFSLLLTWSQVKRLDHEAGIFVSAAMLCVGVRVLDLLLNGWYNALPVFLAGVLIGGLANFRAQKSYKKVGDGLGSKERSVRDLSVDRT